MSLIPDDSTPFGARLRQRLTEDLVIWLTTVGRDLTPQPNPVWFLWDGADSLLVYNRANAGRLANLRRRPRLSLNFNSDGGTDIKVMTGYAEFVEGRPPVTDFPAYVEKYHDSIIRVSGSVEVFAKSYPVPLTIHLTGVRGF